MQALILAPFSEAALERLSSSLQVTYESWLDTRILWDPEKLAIRLNREDMSVLVVESDFVFEEVFEAAPRLRFVGICRGATNQIDVEAATERGVLVVNTPGRNANAVAEHTLALMLALSRNIPSAHQSLKEGQWRRSAFMGIEVHNKTLGIAGLGRVGSEVARRAQSFGMRLLAYDPFVSPDYARRLGVELLPLEQLLAQSDFLTLHTPLTDSTHHLIGARELAMMKPGARLINVARGELIDEEALFQALESDRLAGVALDVFAQEPPGQSPLLSHPKVVATPHLGASTQEAQREVAVEAAEQVLAVLAGEPARNTVNAPFLAPEAHKELSPYLQVASLVGKLLTDLAEGQFLGITVVYQGEIAKHDTAILKAAVLAGLLGPVSSEHVNLINAPFLAQQRGLNVTEQRNPAAQEYASLLTATLDTTGGGITLAGTSMRDEAHIVKVNDYWVDITPSVPYLLFVDNEDQPGSIGAVGTVTGRHNINISFMEVGRLSLRGRP
ncbi:MAG: phosphoglycerate dehydrogenase, partial [Chloroflexi bacterium]|nr:phosphoglycerate dehydrogenase [Chloroflexota bacterium]